MLKDCVANFDLVDEFGQSIELWIHQTLPSSSRISEVILQVAKFIAEFCSLYETSPPPFLRIGIDRHCFGQFNIPLDLHTEVTAQPKPSLSHLHDSGEGDHSDRGVDKGSERGGVSHHTIGTSVMFLTKKEMHLYLYYRWMWIQFPWLAMPSVTSHSADEGDFSENYAATVAAAKSAIKSLESESDSANKGGRGGSRIMNLMSSPVKVSKKGSQFGGDEVTEGGNILEPTPSLASPIKKPSRVSVSESLLSIEEMKRREVATRSWQAKKLDPSLGPVISTSTYRTNALVKSRYPPLIFLRHLSFMAA